MQITPLEKLHITLELFQQSVIQDPAITLLISRLKRISPSKNLNTKRVAQLLLRLFRKMDGTPRNMKKIQETIARISPHSLSGEIRYSAWKRLPTFFLENKTLIQKLTSEKTSVMKARIAFSGLHPALDAIFDLSQKLDDTFWDYIERVHANFTVLKLPAPVFPPDTRITNEDL